MGEEIGGARSYSAVRVIISQNAKSRADELWEEYAFEALTDLENISAWGSGRLAETLFFPPAIREEALLDVLEDIALQLCPGEGWERHLDAANDLVRDFEDEVHRAYWQRARKAFASQFGDVPQ